MAEHLAKIARIRDELNRGFLERADLIDGALTALLSSNHVLVIGPPGTAKSMLADELCRRIEGANYFQWLLTKFSTPEEIFGAVSLKGLEEDDYRRVTLHKLPEAHIAFLDEIFKANSSILNALLTVINERVFHNGRERVQVPLITMFGASNELPDEDELTALYDRFMLRFMVDYISEEFRFLKMLEGAKPEARTVMTFAELDAARADTAQRVDTVGHHQIDCRPAPRARDPTNCRVGSALAKFARRAARACDRARHASRHRGRPDLPRARAVERSRGAAEGARGDSPPGQGLRGGSARTPDPEPGIEGIRARPRMGERGAAQPRADRGAHQDRQHPGEVRQPDARGD